MRKKRVRRRLVRVLFSVGAEWSPYHRFCRGIEFFLLSAWECKKGTGDGRTDGRTDGQTEKGLVLPLPPLPPWNVQGNEETDSGREAHLVPQLLLQNTQSFAISISRQESTLAALQNAECRRCACAEAERKRFMKRRVLISIMKPHLAFSIHPPSLRFGMAAARVFTFNYPRIHHPFDPPLCDVRPSANLHLNQGLLWCWRRRRRKRREANNQPTN